MDTEDEYFNKLLSIITYDKPSLTYSKDWNQLKSAQELWNKVESIMLLG